MNDLISVIVPVYNVEKYLERCVNSIINQTYTNLEIILVDDGSTDYSGKICDSLSTKDSRIFVVHKENGGLSSARNAGIVRAKGKFVGFVDSDDYIDKEMYNSLSKPLNEDVKISCCGRYNVFGEKCKVGLCPVKTQVVSSEEMFDKMLQRKECDVSVCDKLFSKDLFDDIAFYEGIINEDANIIYDLILKSKSVGLIASPMYFYFHRENSITTTPFSDKNLVIIDNAKIVENLVNKNFSGLKLRYKSYYGKLIIELLASLQMVDKITKRKYKQKYKDLKQELKNNFYYLTFRDKLKYMLLKVKLYSFVQKLTKLLYLVYKNMKKYKIGYTTGVFDMFHIGHLNILRRAKEQCEYLIVGVSTDALVQQYKHKKPMIPFADRVQIVESIRYVDKVVAQTTMDKLSAWNDLHFDVLFHGSDWKGSSMYDEIESRLKSVGCDMVFLPHTNGISSTIIAEKLGKESDKQIGTNKL